MRLRAPAGRKGRRCDVDGSEALEKVREIAGKLWLHKEKVLLAVLFGVLIVQVWRGMRQSTDEDGVVNPVPPKGQNVPYIELDEKTKEDIRSKFPLVTAVPLTPDSLASVPAAKLTEDNPFSIWRLNEVQEDKEEEGPEIVVRAIRPGMNDVLTAKLVINGKHVQYEEGEEKDGFHVEEIDEETQTVKVFSESHGKRFTYTRR